ncbi:ribonuclease H-like domain-containing protein [Tanacetum coccineum]|uniref:Ribonuclease H-like domain-containing protein n=1 Tax=Tanacetum coccineum TaxID=301880 RepID=A0ABQ5A2R7_9ASTR
MGLWYTKDSDFELTGFLDADYAGCKDTFKSTSSGAQFLGEKLVSWSSKKQDCTVLSTVEAEYVSLSACCAQAKDQDIKIKLKDIKSKIKIQDHKHAEGTSKEFPRIQGSKIQDVIRRLFLSQKKYALQLLERAHMVTCNPSRTPIDTESKLGPKGTPIQDPTLYRSLARGSSILLLYGTLDLGLHLYASSTTSLVGYIDDDWAGRPSTRSVEAEYQGVANVVVETAWLCNLLRELHSPLSTATLVICDNVSAVYMSANPVQHQQMKHIEIDIHFVRDMVTAG